MLANRCCPLPPSPLPILLKHPLGGNLSSCSGSAWSAKRSCHLIVSFCTKAARSTCKQQRERTGRERRKGFGGGGLMWVATRHAWRTHRGGGGLHEGLCPAVQTKIFILFIFFFLQKLQHLSHSLLPRRAPFLVSLRAWAQVNGVTAKAAEIGHYYALGTDCSWRTFSAATGSSGAAMTYTNNYLERKIRLRMKRRWKY